MVRRLMILCCVVLFSTVTLGQMGCGGGASPNSSLPHPNTGDQPGTGGSGGANNPGDGSGQTGGSTTGTDGSGGVDGTAGTGSGGSDPTDPADPADPTDPTGGGGQVDPGPALVCTPGATVACYTGPAGTEGVGTCIGGMKTCLADGSGYGVCEGEVVPLQEVCGLKTADEDCNGIKEPCPGEVLFAEGFAGPGKDASFALAKTPEGGIYMTGVFEQTIDFGLGPMTSSGSSDLFIARYQSDGAPISVKKVGGSGFEAAYDIAVDHSGNLFVTGSFAGVTDFGNGDRTSAFSSLDAFLAKYDPAGNLLWVKTFGEGGSDFGVSVAVDSVGNVVVAGHFMGSVNFGSLNNLVSAGNSDIFVAKFSSVGAPIWSKRFGSIDWDQLNDLVIDQANNVYLAGRFVGQTNLGAANIVSLGGTDAFLMRLDGQLGNLAWAKRFGGILNDEIHAIAVLNDKIAAVGSFEDAAKFGLNTLVSEGANDIVLAVYQATDGAVLSNQSFGSVNIDDANGLAFDSAGNLFVTGRFSGPIQFGSLTGLNPHFSLLNPSDIFVVCFDPNFNPLWAKRFGATSSDSGTAIVAGDQSKIWVTGSFSGVVDFETNEWVMSDAGGTSPNDIFLIQMTW